MNDLLVNSPGVVACLAFCGWPALWGLAAWWLRGMVARRGVPRISWSNDMIEGGDDDE